MRLFSFIAVLLLPLALSCGFNTHNEIAHRAFYAVNRASSSSHSYKSKWLSSILADHQDAFQGGAPFPDWGYLNGMNSGASEAAHWEPFMDAAVKYVREKFPVVEQWDDDAKKLVAFLFGADSHQIADINWHGLGEAAPRWSTLPGTGFLNVLGALEYNCNGTLCSDAHTEGDIGGDFVVSTQMDLAWLKTLWYIPSNHLAEIYKRMNQTFKDPVTPDKIASSMAVILVGAHAEKTLASLIYPYYYSKSPFLASKMQDHYIGGIDDDATWTTWRWERLVDSFIGNTTKMSSVQSNRGKLPDISFHKKNVLTAFLKSFEPLNFANTLSYQNGHHIQVNEEELKRHLESMIPSLVIDTKYAAENSLSLKDCILNPKECLSDAITFGSNVIERIKESIEEIAAKEMKSTESIFANSTSYEYFGKSIAVGDFNGDGLEDFAVGAPGFASDTGFGSGFVESRTGRVYVYFRLEKSAFSYKVIHLDGIEDGGRFGWSLLSIDLNKDGISDLVVSAPSGCSRYEDGGYPHAHYRGCVYVYNGKSGKLFDESQKADLIIIGKEDDELAAFGFTMKAFDVNNDGFLDLVIGSPFAYGGSGRAGQESGDADPYKDRKMFAYRGLVNVILAKHSYVSGAVISPSESDLSVRGDSDYELFGWDIAFTKLESEILMIVGSPGYLQSSGRIQAYIITSEENKIGATKKFDVIGDSPLSEFGYAVAVGRVLSSEKQSLLVSSPSQNLPLQDFSAGIVQILHIDLLKGHYQISALEFLQINGTQPLGRFGSTIKIEDVNYDGIQDFIVSEPLSQTKLAKESGSVYIFQGGSNVAVDAWKSSFVLRQDLHYARFGIDFAFLSDSDGLKMLVGAHRSNDNSIGLLQSGSVSIFTFDKK